MKIKILTEISYYILRIIGRMPDRVMRYGLRLLDKLMSDFKFDIVGFYIKDVLAVYEKGKPYTDIVKGILLKSREKELRDLLRGIFEKE